MSKSKSADNPQASVKSKPGLGQRSLLLSAVGALISGYLLYHHMSLRSGVGQGNALCNLGGSFDCDAVALSSFSQFLGLPLGVYGLLFYLLLSFLCISFSPKGNSSDEEKHSFSNVLLFFSVVAFIPSLYLAYVSMVYLGKVCLFCFLLYLINLLLVLLSYFVGRQEASLVSRLLNGAKSSVSYFIPTSLSIKGLSPLLVLLGLSVFLYHLPGLITQYVIQPKKFDQKLEQVVEHWKNQSAMDIPIDTLSSFETRDFSLGSSPESKFTIVEFSDFQCPLCKRVAPVLKKIVKENPSVRLVYKNYPLDASCRDGEGVGLHKLACQASILARCAGLQGDESFWRMHDAIFALENYQWSVEKLLSLPAELGFDENLITECFNAGAAKKRVKQDVRLGDQLGITGTPSIFLNGKALKLNSVHLPTVISRILKE